MKEQRWASIKKQRWTGPLKACGVLCVSAALLCGCAKTEKNQSSQKTGSVPASGKETTQNSSSEGPGAVEADKVAVCNNAASLLHDLLGQEKNVSKILLIKKKAPAFEKLIKDISKTADDGEKQLDHFAKDNPTLDLQQMSLPPGEVAARKAQSKAQEHTLLAAKNETFEFDLLLTQAEALDYGSHLAGVAAENSTIPGEERVFNALETDLNGLYMQAIAEMRALPRVTDRRDRDNKKKPPNS
jgi:hypothetical protein